MKTGDHVPSTFSFEFVGKLKATSAQSESEMVNVGKRVGMMVMVSVVLNAQPLKIEKVVGVKVYEVVA